MAATADRFYRFFVGAPLYQEMAELFGPFAPLNATTADGSSL